LLREKAKKWLPGVNAGCLREQGMVRARKNRKITGLPQPEAARALNGIIEMACRFHPVLVLLPATLNTSRE
jgi:hypothetical protein